MPIQSDFWAKWSLNATSKIFFHLIIQFQGYCRYKIINAPKSSPFAEFCHFEAKICSLIYVIHKLEEFLCVDRWFLHLIIQFQGYGRYKIISVPKSWPFAEFRCFEAKIFSLFFCELTQDLKQWVLTGCSYDNMKLNIIYLILINTVI